MSKKIEKLSKKQIDQMPIFVNNWLKLGLSTEPSDRKSAEAGAVKAYASAGLKPPATFIWLRSPLEGAIGASILCGKKEEASDEVKNQIYTACYGQHDAGWLSFYSYMSECLGVKEAKKLDGIFEISRSCGWWWPFENAVIFTDRPTYISRDSQNRLHSEDRKAIEYADGFGVYSWHGVVVPEKLIKNPELISVSDIDSEENAEVRRCMLERFGVERFIVESKSKPVSFDEYGELYRRELPGDEPIVIVKVKNSTPEPDGSIKDYFLRVHPELRPMLGGQNLGKPQSPTPRNAIASTFGLTGEQYSPLRQT